MMVKNITGSQGSWEVTVTYADGTKEVLPCVHQYFWKVDQQGRPYYDDPWASTADEQSYAIRQSTQFAKHIDLLRSKRRVVLTEDKVTESKRRAEGFFERTGYIGVFDIDDFVLDDKGMRFVSWEG